MKANKSNNESKYYYVYKHTNKLNKKCYVGITSMKVEDRWRNNGKAYIRKNKNGKYSHLKFALAIQKYGWDNFTHEIIEEGFFTKEEIERCEIYWIEYYDSFNNGYNTTKGGNISLWSKTDIGKETVSESVKKLWEDEQYRRKNITPVKCVENNYIFQSAKEIADLLHVNSCNIRACCNGKQKYAYGYHWEFSNWNDYDIFYKQNKNYLNDFLLEHTKIKNNEEPIKLEKSSNKKLKPILCIDKGIAYQGQVIASEITGIDRTGIGLCCLNKQDKCGGYKWKFIEEDEYLKYKETGMSDIPIPINKNNRNIPVLCVETNIVYNNMAEAYKQTGIKHISECCKGLLKTAGGYHWKLMA